MQPTGTSLIAIGSYGEKDALTTWWWDGVGALERAGAADVAAPSYVAWHPRLPVLYAVSELPTGFVTAFSVSPTGTLERIGAVETEGAEPCFAACDAAGSILTIANYDIERGKTGMTAIGLDASGAFSGKTAVVRHTGSGPVADRQQVAHVHQTLPTPQGTVLATDLGADTVTEYRVSRGGATALAEVAMPAGSGPRHLALDAGGRVGYVAGELDATVTVIRRGARDGWTVGESVPATSAAAGAGVPAGRVYPSHVALAGRWLLVANRGTNTLAALDVSQGLSIASEAAVTAWPRHFTVTGVTGGPVVLVAGQHGNVVQALALDPATGALTDRGTVAEIPAASCVACQV